MPQNFPVIILFSKSRALYLQKGMDYKSSVLNKVPLNKNHSSSSGKKFDLNPAMADMLLRLYCK